MDINLILKYDLCLKVNEYKNQRRKFMYTYNLNGHQFTYKVCEDLRYYFPKQHHYAWHCRLDSKSLHNQNLSKSLDIWIAGDNNSPNIGLLQKALDIKTDLTNYVEESCIFDIQWLNEVKMYTFFSGLEEIHNYRQDKEWLSALYLLDPKDPEKCVLGETYGCFSYQTLFEHGHACDKILA
jgi:hypothetical protein